MYNNKEDQGPFLCNYSGLSLIFAQETMAGLFKFIFSKSFVKQGILAAITLVALILLLFFWMSSYTSHGQEQPVPDLIGMDLRAADQLLHEQGLRLVPEDSSYVEGAKPGSIISQNPAFEYMPVDSSGVMKRMVKKNRKIYVTIASYLPPRVEIPDLVGKSKRIALDLLAITGIKVEAMEYVPDNVCTDCVLKQLYKGKKIEAGTKLYKGESITLILGKKDASYVNVPKITGFTYKEAKNILNRLSLNMGTVLGGCDDCISSLDTAQTYILQQTPDIGGSLNVGGSIDVYLTDDPSLIR
jgi:beta-lactam-binding protein with PASTA domain